MGKKAPWFPLSLTGWWLPIIASLNYFCPFTDPPLCIVAAVNEGFAALVWDACMAATAGTAPATAAMLSCLAIAWVT